MAPDEIASVLRTAATAVNEALRSFQGSGLSGQRHDQYALDLVADRAACDVLSTAGLSIFSEESGHTGGGDLVAVVDPVDGSTNADRGIPFYCVSISVVDERGPLVSLVENLVVGTRYEAQRGRGATRNGVPITVSEASDPSKSIIGVNGVLDFLPGWAQVRTMGAAALELCLVAEGALDAYLQAPGAAIHPWDYLAGMHIAEEAGAAVRSSDGRELVILEAESRRPLVAASDSLADALVAQVERPH